MTTPVPKVNFGEVFDMGQWIPSDDAKFVKQFAIDEQAKGELSDTEIMTQCLQHLVRESNSARVAAVYLANKQAAESIARLEHLGEWGNLRRIAKEALTAAIKSEHAAWVAEGSRRRSALSTLYAADKVRLAAMDEGSSNFEEVFYASFLIKHGFPTEVEPK